MSTKDKKKNIEINEDLDCYDLSLVLVSDIKERGLVSHHIDSMNDFNSVGIKQIITQGFKAEFNLKNERDKSEEDKKIQSIQGIVEFTDVDIIKPTIDEYYSGKSTPLFPNAARKSKLNYSSALYVDAQITVTAIDEYGGEKTRTAKIKNFKIANIPCMVGSTHCNTYGLSRIAKKIIEEDPRDEGGYFILSGGEWVISCLESRTFNIPHIFRNIGHEKEVSRLEFLSKPGDAYENSSSIKIRLMTNGSIIFTFDGSDYLNTNIPFWLVFVLMGMPMDKEINDNIIHADSESASGIIIDHMKNILVKAHRVKDEYFYPVKEFMEDREQLLKFVAEKLDFLEYKSTAKYKPDQRRIDYKINNIMKLLDIKLFPHIGRTPDKRHAKLKYLGHLIHQLLLVEYKIVKETDRDSLKNKRTLAAGRSYAKVFKRTFNDVIIRALKTRLRNDFKEMSFSQVVLEQCFSSIDGGALEKTLIQSITSGKPELMVKNKKVANRLASEMLTPKNNLHLIAAKRTVRVAPTSSSNAADRSKEMRMVHNSYPLYICPNQSADTGEQVGLVKQMAVGAFISRSSSNAYIKKILLTDPDIIHEEYIMPNDIYENQLTKIIVNGDLIGYTADGPVIVQKYREFRRGISFTDFNSPSTLQGKHLLDQFVTIHWDTESSMINFHTDAGRMMAPLLIVRNNSELDPFGRSLFDKHYDPYNDTGFEQIPVLTKNMVKQLARKEISISDLLLQGVLEYLAPEEIENCLISESIENLYENRYNSLRRYTHCQIPPAILGLPALTSPYTNNSQLARITFQTNQRKQTTSIPVLNWAYRVDKHLNIQHYCERPIIETLANEFIYPDGINAYVAILCYSGYNMEDSLIFNKSASDRGFVKVTHRSFVMTELEPGESFGIPNSSIVRGIKASSDYSKLDSNGVVPIGTVLKKGDIVIGKTMKVINDNEIIYYDKSVAYKSHEIGVVKNVIRARDHLSNEFVKVIFSNVRPLGIGDKFSSRHGQKGESSQGFIQEDMPFTESGIVPDLILNPAAFPSRMTIGQLIESLASILHLHCESIGDATAFCKNDVVWLSEQLESMGLSNNGTERIYSGITGEWMDVMVFCAPVYYQRLQKFVVEQVYSISSGPSDMITRQPLEGKSNNGGLRIGEMEKDVLVSHGGGCFIMEKFRDDSDGFDIYVCRTCGKMPLVNEYKNIAVCHPCGKMGLTPDIYKVPSTWASKTFIQELESMNMGVRLELTPFKYEQFMGSS